MSCIPIINKNMERPINMLIIFLFITHNIKVQKSRHLGGNDGFKGTGIADPHRYSFESSSTFVGP